MASARAAAEAEKAAALATLRAEADAERAAAIATAADAAAARATASAASDAAAALAAESEAAAAALAAAVEAEREQALAEKEAALAAARESADEAVASARAAAAEEKAHALAAAREQAEREAEEAKRAALAAAKEAADEEMAFALAAAAAEHASLLAAERKRASEDKAAAVATAYDDATAEAERIIAEFALAAADAAVAAEGSASVAADVCAVRSTEARAAADAVSAASTLACMEAERRQIAEDDAASLARERAQSTWAQVAMHVTSIFRAAGTVAGGVTSAASTTARVASSTTLSAALQLSRSASSAAVTTARVASDATLSTARTASIAASKTVQFASSAATSTASLVLPASAKATVAARTDESPNVMAQLEAGLAFREGRQYSRRMAVALSGMVLRGPGGIENAAALYQMRSCAHDCISHVPACRWNCRNDAASADSCTAHGGFMFGVDMFDAALFGISAEEASTMDPQQRLIVEYGYASLHKSSLVGSGLHGAADETGRCGVFVGIQAIDQLHATLVSKSACSSANAAFGVLHSIAAGRLSYTLSLHGPSAAYDTACSSAHVAAHAAYVAVVHAEASSALAVGVHAMILPSVHRLVATCGMMSPTGRCATFDCAADGYARAEAIGSVTMRKDVGSLKAGAFSELSQYMGSAVRQDGGRTSLTAPNGKGQEAVLRASLVASGMPPDGITLCEAHGTGTALGDPTEAESLAAAILRTAAANTSSAVVGTMVGHPHLTTTAIAVSSAKANIGHAEPSAAMLSAASLITTLATCATRRGVAPNARLRQPSPHVCNALDVPTMLPMNALAPCRCTLRYDTDSNTVLGDCLPAGGFSSFGYSGTVSHSCLRVLETAVQCFPHPAPILRRRHFAFIRGQQATSQPYETHQIDPIQTHQTDPIQTHQTDPIEPVATTWFEPLIAGFVGCGTLPAVSQQPSPLLNDVLQRCVNNLLLNDVRAATEGVVTALSGSSIQANTHTTPHSADMPLSVLGLDSVGAIELRGWLMKGLGVPLHNVNVRSDSTASTLAAAIISKVAPAISSASLPSSHVTSPECSRKPLLSSERIVDLINEFLDFYQRTTETVPRGAWL